MSSPGARRSQCRCNCRRSKQTSVGSIVSTQSQSGSLSASDCTTCQVAGELFKRFVSDLTEKPTGVTCQWSRQRCSYRMGWTRSASRSALELFGLLAGRRVCSCEVSARLRRCYWPPGVCKGGAGPACPHCAGLGRTYIAISFLIIKFKFWL